VDVPQSVSRAFEAHARAGRISVVGTLNTTRIRATLIPVRRGRHRLFVNGGMRSAAGVGVGDTVTFELRPTKPDLVPLPSDVAAGLRSISGALRAFRALAPSHRRELLRYIDDARTPETRRRRIEKSVAHVAGREVPAEGRVAQRALWTCPRCGSEFVNRNQYHSCKRYELDDPFRGKSPHVRELFERFRAMVERCGPVKVLPYRDKIGFMVRVRFAGAVPRSQWLDVAFWLPRRINHRRFHKVETISPSAHIHMLRVKKPAELDGRVAAWLREAYAVGRQEHLAR
jgi:hypothetical protein